MLKSNKGFTLVEVVAAFAVLAIVSVALLQMFLVSSTTNKKASDMDMANAISIRVAEQFKAAPEQPQNINELAGASISPGGIYLQWYDTNWTTVSAITDAKFELAVTTAAPITVTTIGASYLPEFSWTGGVDPIVLGTPNTSYTITIFNPFGAAGTKITTQCCITLTNDTQSPPSMIPFPIDILPDENIPIRLQCDLADENTSYSGTLTINNTAKKWDPVQSKDIDTIADIYICNNPTGGGIKPLSSLGAYKVTNASTRQNTTMLYNISIVIRRIADDLKLRESNVDKYLTKAN